MIKHMIDSVGMIFSKINSIRPIPKQVLDNLYIQYGIDNIGGNLVSYSDVFDIGIVLIYTPIGEYDPNTIFTIETFKTIPSGIKTDMSKYSNTARYILVPDIVKYSDTDENISDKVSIVYNIFSEIVNSIKYKEYRIRDTIESLPLLLTSYILCEYGITPSPASTLKVLLGDIDNIPEISDTIDDHNIIESLNAGINITRDYFKSGVRIRRDAKCQIITL